MAPILDTKSTYPAPDNGLRSGGPLLPSLGPNPHLREDRWPLRRTFLFAVVVSTLAWGAIISTAIQIL